jgi:hypothetical protein
MVGQGGRDEEDIGALAQRGQAGWMSEKEVSQQAYHPLAGAVQSST